MMIRASAVLLFAVGVFFFVMSKLSSLFQLMMLDWIGIASMGAGLFILLFCLGLAEVNNQFDTIPPNTAPIYYLRRDGIVAPLLGKRVYAGESFLDIPKLGLIEDLGKDTVYSWGRKKIRFGLENLNFTPNPYYNNWCAEMYRLGIDDMNELYNLLNVDRMPYESPAQKTLKVHYLSLMADVYMAMMESPLRGGPALQSFFRSRHDKNTVFGKERERTISKDVNIISRPRQETTVKTQEPTPRVFSRHEPIQTPQSQQNYDIDRLDEIINRRRT